MESLLRLIEKIYNSIRYNGFYILMSLFFPLLIWKLDAGKELFISMSEQPYGNIAFSITSFASLGFSIWAIPTLAIRFFTWLVLPKAPTHTMRARLWRTFFERSVALDNGISSEVNGTVIRSQIPIRYFSILPWLLSPRSGVHQPLLVLTCRITLGIQQLTCTGFIDDPLKFRVLPRNMLNDSWLVKTPGQGSGEHQSRQTTNLGYLVLYKP